MRSLDDLQVLKHNNYTIEICIPICVIYPPSKLMCLTFLFGCVLPISILMEEKLNSCLLHCCKHILHYLKFNVKKKKELFIALPQTQTQFSLAFKFLYVFLCCIIFLNNHSTPCSLFFSTRRLNFMIGDWNSLSLSQKQNKKKKYHAVHWPWGCWD